MQRKPTLEENDQIRLFCLDSRTHSETPSKKGVAHPDFKGSCSGQSLYRKWQLAISCLLRSLRMLLPGQLVSGPVTYDVRISDGAVTSDSTTRFQTLLAQVLENSLAVESQTAITVVLDFVRIAHVVGATSSIKPLTGAATRVNKSVGRVSQVTNLQGVTP